LESTNKAISLGIASLIVIALILVAGFGAFLASISVGTTAVTNVDPTTSTSVATPATLCLYPIPASATVTSFGNSTTVGNFVTFTNSTRLFFPLNSCPQPAPPQLYAIASIIEQNASFVAAENGTTFVVNQGVGFSYYQGVTSAIVVYSHYSNEPYAPCGPSNGWGLKELAQLQVIVPISKTGAYDYSNMTFFVVPGSALNVVSCPSIPATSTSQTASTSSVDQISLPEGISLCANSCGVYPNPYLSVTISVNASVPLNSLQLFINGTSELTTSYTNNFTQYYIEYKATPSNASMPIAADKGYLITFIATFADNSKSNASMVVVAS